MRGIKKVGLIGAIVAIGVWLGLGAAAAGTLKIGVITALSGAGALWGKGILNGAEMATEEINARGGVSIRGEKYTVQLVPYDDKYSGAGGVAAANRLVFQDKVSFIIGSISSASILAFQEVTEENRVLVLANSWARETLSPKKPFTLRVFMSGVEGTPLLVRWLTTTHGGLKTALTIGPNDASGWSITKDAEEAYAKHGIKFLGKEYYERGTKDFYPVMTRVKGLAPDIIHFTGAPTGDAGLMVKQGREIGLKSQFVDSTSADPRTLVEVAGKESAEGYIWGAFFDPNSPKVAAFAKRYQDKYSRPIPTYVDPAFYQATQALFYAMEKCQCLEADKVRDTLKRIPEFDGIMGKFEFGGTESYGINNQLLSSYYASQVKDGVQIILKQLR